MVFILFAFSNMQFTCIFIFSNIQFLQTENFFLLNPHIFVTFEFFNS